MDDTNDKELLTDNFPSNSKTKRIVNYPDTHDKKQEGEGTRPRVNKVISGNAKQRKPSLGKRLAGTLLEDNTKSVGDYIIHDVLIPAAKSMICDMVGWGGFAEMLLFGGNSRRGSSTYREGGKQRTNYGSAYRSFDRGDARDRRDTTKLNRSRHDLNDVIFGSRGAAEEVLSHLVDLTIDYDSATVADLYDLAGITGDFTDNKWGWTDLSSASVRRDRDGYIINLPRPIPLVD